MEPKLTITLPFVGKSPNVKRHWTVDAKFAKACKAYIRPKLPRLLLDKVQITLTRVGRKMDQGNLGNSFKPIEDALSGWIMTDDNPDVLDVTYQQRRQQKGEKPHVVIEIYF